MNKKLVFVLAALIVLGATFAAVLLSPQQMPPTTQQTGDSNPSSQQPPTNAAPAIPGEYRDYQDGNIQNTAGTKILFFYASWCPQCRALEKSIKEGTIPSGVTIFKVDYDSNQALRQKYGVTIQTSLVKVDDSGNLVAKYVAYDQPTLQALIEHLL